jgi:methionine salvage enolase-phosphatase E1
VSDLAEELAAARLAGLQVVIAVRSDMSAPRGLAADQIIRTFADLG